MPGTPTRYDDEQVGQILQRAAELQGGLTDTRRMSLEEIQAIASEAGIDTALVQQAARELSRPPTQHQDKQSFLGAASSLHFEARIAWEISSECFDLLLHEIHVVLGEAGTSTRSAKSLSWQSTQTYGQPGRRIAVTVTAARGETLVRIDEKLQTLIGGLYGGVLGGLGGGGLGLIVVPIMFAPWAAPLFVGGWLGGVYLLARTIYQRSVGRREQELHGLLQRLVGLCHENPTPALPPAQGGKI